MKQGQSMVMGGDFAAASDSKIADVIDQQYPAPMQADTVRWLAQLFRPLILAVINEPVGISYAKMLPGMNKNPSTSGLENSLMLDVSLNSAVGSGPNADTAALRIHLLRRVNEFMQILDANSVLSAQDHNLPASLCDYIKNTLLQKPPQDSLFNFELNRIRYESDGMHLDQAQMSGNEEVLLTGMMLIAKFLLVKMLFKPSQYNMGFGGNMSDQVSLNIKMVATFMYSFAFRPYMESSIRIKNQQFKNDQDGGMQRLLYDPDYIS